MLLAWTGREECSRAEPMLGVPCPARGAQGHSSMSDGRATLKEPHRLEPWGLRVSIRHWTGRSLLTALLVAALLPVPVSAAEPTPVTLDAVAVQPAMTLAAQTPGPVVIDYTGPFRSSTPTRLKRGGVGVAIRYVGSAKWKCLTRREANALRSAGIDIAAVYETKAGWMLSGRKAGVAAAKKARAAVRACGGPKQPFIYFACDVATKRYSAVNACLRGAASVLGARNVGIYGSYSVCDNALKSGYATKAWQTEAWSSGKVLSRAALYQNAHRVHGNLGLDYDSNFTRADDIGQWGYKGAAKVTWAAQSASTSAALTSVDFVSSTTGWVVGDAGTIKRTADGGATWISQTSTSTATLLSIDFANSTTGWTVGDDGTVLRTANGGTNWAAQSVPTSATLRSVACADVGTGVAVGDEGTVLRTVDGGSTWTTQSVPASATLRAVDFVGAATGWAVGDNGTVLRTTNGGSTWTRQSTPTLANLTSVHFTDSTTGWAVGEGGTVLHTVNGLSWVRQPMPTSANLGAVHFTDDVTGWAVGDGGAVLRTANGGLAWTVQSVPPAASLSAVQFTSAATGWAIGNSGAVLHATGTGISAFGTVVGRVTDAVTGKPVGGISVKIGSQVAAPSAVDGTFIETRVRPGTYGVAFSDARYVARTEPGIVVSAGRRTSVKEQLTPRTVTKLTVPAMLPIAALSGQPVSLVATLTPAAAAGAAAAIVYGSHYERKTVAKKVHGKKKWVRVWYWRPRVALPMTADASGRLTINTTLASGAWRIQVKYRGSGKYLPTTSAAKILYVR
jgi:photosystem II stability/assembly factor-like uncharacterized protein